MRYDDQDEDDFERPVSSYYQVEEEPAERRVSLQEELQRYDEERLAHRPLGVSLYAGLSVISGTALLLLAGGLLVFGQVPLANLVNDGMGVVYMIFWGLIVARSGIQMWKGESNGWSVGCFIVVYRFWFNGWRTYMLTQMLNDPQQNLGPDLRADVTRTVVVRLIPSMIVSALILAYLMRRRVLDYFAVGHIHRGAALWRLTWPALIIIAVLTMF